MDVPEYQRLISYYEEYVSFGGFPQVVLAKTVQEKIDRLDEIVSSYINLDVTTLADFSDRKNAYTVIKMLAGRTGGRIDYSKLSRLSGLSRPTVKNLLDLFEGTYLISRIPVLTRNADREIVKAEKLYFCDNGLLEILSDVGSGARFENAIYNQIRHFGEIRYYSIRSGKEIDFIMDKKIAFEVKETPMATDRTYLAGIADQAGIKEYKLIGRHISPHFNDYVWGGSIIL